MKHKLLLSAVSMAFIFLAGCAANELAPGGEKVLVSKYKPESKKCKFKGQVTGDQGNFFTGGFTSNKNMEVGALNSIRSQAAALGANYVEMITDRAAMTFGGGGSSGHGWSNFSMNGEQTNVVMTGNAYNCPDQ
ncbi:MAG: hypothetical protein A2X78_04160 [Gammaproteobacteria bacterium GWE2_37_16]|nr:MAG: hypothetical protein A2X78_04160 [Gammaproteobacteria bacterium GWE2_37_16]